MADIYLIALSAHDIGERQVFNTGVSTVGRGGDDYYCGHCGRKMMHNYDARRLEVEIIYECGGCRGHNILPEIQTP